MKKAKQEAIIEAVLFSVGESVKTEKLAELIGATPEQTKKIINEMKTKMEA